MTARAFARRRTNQYGAGGVRGTAEAQKKMPRSPDATQRCQFRSPTTHSTHWAHPGASMRRYGSPIVQRGARVFAPPNTEHPNTAPAVRAAPRRHTKCATEPDATKVRQFRSPTTLIAHWAHSGASMRRYGFSPIARRRARSRAAEHTPKWPRGWPWRRTQRHGGAKKGATEPRRDPEAPV